MKRGRKPSEVYVAMLNQLRTAYEEGDSMFPFEKKFSDWAYSFNTNMKKVKSFQFKIRMELAKENIPVIPMFSQSRRGRLYIEGLKVSARNERGFAEVDGDGVRDTKALRGKAINVVIRETARVNSKMLPEARQKQHKQLIGKQAEQFVRLLEKVAKSGNEINA